MKAKYGRQYKAKKSKKVLWIILAVLVILGVTGGVLIKTVFYDKVGDGVMSNAEANRLISYLGINEYEYTDKIGSSFTVKSAKNLLKAADISIDRIGVKIEYLPGFVPLTKKQFESIYDTMIKELELDRLFSANLYIYDVDNTKDKEIDGVVYEVVNTSDGDYFMQKDYTLIKIISGRL